MALSEGSSASGEASGSSENHGLQQHQHSSATSAPSSLNAGAQGTARKKRNLPGTPDPEAEVIALSPTTLMATNRFVCEICGKGFPRDQNLQLHRRGHNLPWKLRQRTSKEPRKRVYICPEPSCVHHEPSRALGDLTGIKKHFCRKHGEKKWKCDKCNKLYAVQSDWKAHAKTCGTREYRCDCGTLFPRRDSFITHRAFCDALAEESARLSAVKQGILLYAPADSSSKLGVCATNQSQLSFHGSTISSPLVSYAVKNPASGLHSEVSGANLPKEFPLMPSRWAEGSSIHQGSDITRPPAAPVLSLWSGPISGSSLQTGAKFGGGLQALRGSDVVDLKGGTGHTTSVGLSLFSAPGLTKQPSAASSSSSVSSILSKTTHTSTTSQMSATALLQKAAQMGATASTSSVLKGYGLSGNHDFTSVKLGTYWQGPQQKQAIMSDSLLDHNLSESDIRTGEFSTESGISASLEPFSSAVQSKSAQQVGDREPTASLSSYAGLFGGNLSTFPPIFRSYTGNGSGSVVQPTRHSQYSAHTVKRNSQGAPESNGTSLMLPGLGPCGKVEEASDGLTRDFLGVSGTTLLPGSSGGIRKTLSQKDIASIASIGIGLDVSSLAKHTQA